MTMKKAKHALNLLLCLALLCCLSFPALCESEGQAVDYAASVSLNLGSETVKQVVTVHTFVDGDTTHFNVPESLVEGGVLKARYLAVNTPESTGKIEEYGKAASRFTREKLSSASSILIETDGPALERDSTGGRYLVWVWYRLDEGEPYRNLNIELLQNGLAIASSSANNRYGTTCMAAIEHAKALKLNLYSGQPDPDFYYGDAMELTLREIRLNAEAYSGKKVAFNGVITRNYNNGVYVESLDEESGLYFGLYVYYGFGLSGTGLDILSVGNEARIVGTLQYYEAGGSYQVSGLTYRRMKPKAPDNIQKLSEGHLPAYVPTDAAELMQGQVTLTSEDGQAHTYARSALAQGTSVLLTGLRVTDGYQNTEEDSSSLGALTLHCQSGDTAVTLRTIPLKRQDGSLASPEDFIGKTIDVKGIVDTFGGQCQLRVFSLNDISFVD